MNKRLLINLSTLWFIGKWPAPGTWATIFTTFFIVIFSRYNMFLDWYFLITIFILILSIAIVKKSILFFEKPDPSEIVLDEVVGTFITFLGIVITPLSIIVGVILFRILDITKPIFITKLEKLPGVAGIFLDDIFAAIIANILLRILFCICTTC
jgi:phosphatidylglycerophosphatase A